MRTSPEFHHNPMGTYVAPEQMMVARAAGATVAELHRRAYAGEFAPIGANFYVPEQQKRTPF